MFLIAVDPGLRDCGVAVAEVQTSAILAAWLSKNPEKRETGPAAWERMAIAVASDIRERGYQLPPMLVIEDQWMSFPRSPKGAPSPSDGGPPALDGRGTRNPKVILTLAHVTGSVMYAVEASAKVCVHPASWKASARKGTVEQRAFRRLSDEERAAVESAETYLGHNVKDSIAIAQWACRNFRRLQDWHLKIDTD